MMLPPIHPHPSQPDARRGRLAAILELYPLGDSGQDEDEVYLDVQRFAIIERSVHDGSHFVATHGSPELAAMYHDGQEYPEDWLIVGLVDLDTGDRYHGVPSTRFELYPDDGHDAPAPQRVASSGATMHVKASPVHGGADARGEQ